MKTVLRFFSILSIISLVFVLPRLEQKYHFFEASTQPRENLTPVGVSTFALGVPDFPRYDTPKSMGIETVAKSVRIIATNQLWDFPEQQDPELVYQFIEKLRNEGFEIYHQIHILNGAGARKRRSRVINSFFNNKPTSAKTFSKELLKNQSLRDKVTNVFSEVVVFSKRLEELGVEVVISPELEDNHKQASFKVLLGCLSLAGWTTNGNLRTDRVSRSTVMAGERVKSKYVRTELHSPSVTNLLKGRYNLRPGDIINLDGKSLRFDKKSKKYYYSSSEVKKIIQYCESKRIIFYIWYAPLQGFKDYKYGGGRVYYGSYFNRNYVLSYPLHLINLLRLK